MHCAEAQQEDSVPAGEIYLEACALCAACWAPLPMPCARACARATIRAAHGSILLAARGRPCGSPQNEERKRDKNKLLCERSIAIHIFFSHETDLVLRVLSEKIFPELFFQKVIWADEQFSKICSFDVRNLSAVYRISNFREVSPGPTGR